MFISSKGGRDVKEVERQLTTVQDLGREKIRIRSMRAAINALVVKTETIEDAQKIMS